MIIIETKVIKNNIFNTLYTYSIISIFKHVYYLENSKKNVLRISSIYLFIFKKLTNVYLIK